MLSLLSGFLVSFSGFVLVYLFHSSGLLKSFLGPLKAPTPGHWSAGRGAVPAEACRATILTTWPSLPTSPQFLAGCHFHQWPHKDNCQGAMASRVYMDDGHLFTWCHQGSPQNKVATTFSFYKGHHKHLMCSHIDTPIFSATQYLLHQEHVMGFI